MTGQNLYVDLHIIQSLPPSNINRDDTGSPKSAVYGGARRARVSSQAWKRAARIAFAARQHPDHQAKRTRKLRELLTERLIRRAGLSPELADRVAISLIKDLGITAGKKDRELSYLLFFGLPQLDAAVDAVAAANLSDAATDADLEQGLSEIRLDDSLSQGHPVDVALFGRMVADLPKLNVDASVQVAHALSTHAVEIHFDYFTAVDDLNQRDETGAGMIGNVEFNSATYYRFASVGMHQLADNLSGSWPAAAAALDTFIESFSLAVPSGHESSFAHRTRPSLVAVVVREDQPVNLVSAFERPVNSDRGVLEASMVRLAESFRAERDRWGDAPIATLASFAAETAEKDARQALETAFGPNLTFSELRDELRDVVAARGDNE